MPVTELVPLSATDRMAVIHGRHSPALHRFLMRLTNGERQTAEDLYQETMLRAWRRVDSIPGDEEGTRRWLFTVARRVVIDFVRMRRCRPREVGDVDLDVLGGHDDTTASAVATRTVVTAFAGLTTIQRDILSAVFLRGNSPAQVAVELGLPVGTVKSRTHYALQALRSRMDGGS